MVCAIINGVNSWFIKIKIERNKYKIMINKILVGIADKLGCGYYRCIVPYRELANFGFDVQIVNRLDSNINVEDTMLVLQRQHDDAVLMLAQDFINRGGKVVFELDDYFHDLPLNNPARVHYPPGGKELRNMEKFLEICPLFTASTPPLAEAYSKWSKNAQVCYNVLDLNDFQKLDIPEREDGNIRIGWAGSATHHDDFLTVLKPITEIMRENKNVYFVFIGMNYANLFPLDIQPRIVFAGHTFPVKDGRPLFYSEDGTNPVSEYYKLVQKCDLDIAIAPILNHTFNRKKSYLKLLEYGIMKIPFVASNFGPYAEYASAKSSLYNDNSIGFLAEKNTEWKKYLKALIQSEELRKKVAENNYNNVIQNHTIKTGVNRWLKALSTIGVLPIPDRKGSFTENFQ